MIQSRWPQEEKPNYLSAVPLSTGPFVVQVFPSLVYSWDFSLAAPCSLDITLPTFFVYLFGGDMRRVSMWFLNVVFRLVTARALSDFTAGRHAQYEIFASASRDIFSPSNLRQIPAHGPSKFDAAPSLKLPQIFAPAPARHPKAIARIGLRHTSFTPAPSRPACAQRLSCIKSAVPRACASGCSPGPARNRLSDGSILRTFPAGKVRKTRCSHGLFAVRRCQHLGSSPFPVFCANAPLLPWSLKPSVCPARCLRPFKGIPRTVPYRRQFCAQPAVAVFGIAILLLCVSIFSSGARQLAQAFTEA
ncbi:hypothetical protein TNIN_205001 [Trichonephila inaurata madagascariensis]|uniref:Transmembrane protein n=1 Tax=Trichonephila inaurata madagascariensis TaxID=2747483 RepID=A0A8X7CJX3_9ARAC|nr:hypothetical protein TNIN_205001 [Trichonephila inaurata madagascariensis]